jgi:lipid A disaccharide synthetase
LREALPGASFSGLGGQRMQEAGQQRIVRAEDVAHMGITEVIRHAPYIYSQFESSSITLEVLGQVQQSLLIFRM